LSASSQPRLTGERPHRGVTPDSLLALHAAGYQAVIDRVGPGRLLDVGCGQGFESARFLAPERRVVGADYSAEAVGHAAAEFAPRGLAVVRTEAAALGFADGSFDAVCSSHLIEHFVDPERHVREMARVLSAEGSAFILTPNEPADFENPFHVHLFDRASLEAMLGRHFEDVWIGAVDAAPRVKEEFAQRRAKARKVLALDVLDLRHKLPHRWYMAAYTRLLPLAYRAMARGETGGDIETSAGDWFVTDAVDDTSLVLFAVAGRPRRGVTRVA
jgi:SAM-dependent methyltransferase